MAISHRPHRGLRIGFIDRYYLGFIIDKRRRKNLFSASQMKYLLTILSVITFSAFVPSVSAQIVGNGGRQEQSEKAKPVEFRVSAVGADKTEFQRIFQAVQAKVIKKEKEKDYVAKAKENRAAANKVTEYVVNQKINAHEFLVHIRHEPDALRWLITQKTYNLADGDPLRIHATRTGNTREYTTVLGAKKTVHEIQEEELVEGVKPVKDAKPKFSEADFIEALKQGKTWKLVDFSKTRCSRCFGHGNLGALNQNAKCNACEGKGVIVSDCLVKW